MDVSNQSMIDEPARSFCALAVGLIILTVPLVTVGIVKRVTKRDRFRRLNMLEKSIDLHTGLICSDETSDSIRDDSWTKLRDAYLEHGKECRRQYDLLQKKRRNCDSSKAAEISSQLEEIQMRDEKMLKRKHLMAT